MTLTDRDRKVIGFYAYSTPTQVVCTKDPEQKGDGLMKVSRCRFFVCKSCSQVFEKKDLRRKIDSYESDANVIIMGDLICGNCGQRHSKSEVYAGVYDLPKAEWSAFTKQTGKEVCLNDTTTESPPSPACSCCLCGTSITTRAPWLFG